MRVEERRNWKERLIAELVASEVKRKRLARRRERKRRDGAVFYRWAAPVREVLFELKRRELHERQRCAIAFWDEFAKREQRRAQIHGMDPHSIYRQLLKVHTK